VPADHDLCMLLGARIGQKPYGKPLHAHTNDTIDVNGTIWMSGARSLHVCMPQHCLQARKLVQHNTGRF
jgi:hypothetical protein